MSKAQILEHIQKIAEANGGEPPGKLKFYQLTGIKESDWSGKYWVRWSDAVAEAGYMPKQMQGAFSDEHILSSYLGLIRELGHIPTSAELRMKSRNDQDFPSHNTFSRYGSKKRLIGKLIDFVKGSGANQDILPMLEAAPHESGNQPSESESESPADGYVYLMQFGSEYKIGTSNNVERRFRELKTQMPYEGKIIHTIATGDPEGIEAYWHQYFSENRLKGEWFKLSKAEVAYFKKRKLM